MDVVVRNCLGSVLGALSQRIQLPASTATVELLACRKAMLFARELRAMDCIFQGDTEVIIQAIRNKDSTHPDGHVINDVLSLARDLQFCSFSHVKCIMFGFIFLITLNFHYSSLITHHSIFHTRLASSPNFHHSIFFTLFLGPYLSASATFYFLFSFFVFVFTNQTHQS